jgi:hypothetical protein
LARISKRTRQSRFCRGSDNSADKAVAVDFLDRISYAVEDTFTLAQECARTNLNRIASELGADSVSISLNPHGESEEAATLVHRWREVAIRFGFGAAAAVPPLLPEALIGYLDLIAAGFQSIREAEKLRAELKAANTRLATRKIVERAKGLLQAQRGLTEDSAYAYLRGESRSRRITLARVAEEVVRTHSSPVS